MKSQTLLRVGALAGLALAALALVYVLRGSNRRAAARGRNDDDEIRASPLVYPPGKKLGADLIDSLVNLHSLEEARTMEHTAVVMQGDAGAQIYLTVPVQHVACDENALLGLLEALDALECRNPASAALSFELAPIGSGVFGGMGGGLIIDGVWLHERLHAAGVLPLATSVLYGRRPLGEVLADFPRAVG